MKKLFLAVSILFLAGAAARAADPAAGPGWKFAVLSDIHVGKQADPAQSLGASLKDIIQRLVEERPDFVVIAGDFTRGNPNDNVSLEKVRTWWLNIQAGMKPLADAGIPVVPLPGNHDFYTPAQRQAYEEAWKYFQPSLAAFDIQGSPPFYYSFTHKDAHFVQLRIVDQEIAKDEEAWLKKDLAQAQSAGLRFAFGHVPLASAMASKPNLSFKKQLGGLLADGNVAAYICGHEHLDWDQKQEFNGRPLRQIIVGSAMNDPYTFAIRKELYASYCRACDGECMMPYTGKHFATDPKTRLQKLHQTFYMFEVSPEFKDGYSATPYTLDENGRLAPFYDATGAGRLAPCPAGAMKPE